MEKYEGNNSAVLKSLQIIPVEGLTYIPNKSSFSYSELTIAVNSAFSDIEFTPYSGRWSEKENEGKGGNYFKKEVFCSLPCIRSEISLEMENFRNRRLASLVTEINGETRLVFPLRLKMEKSVPGTPSGWNGYDLLFSGEGNKQSPAVTNLP
jgi:hypothetical protein